MLWILFACSSADYAAKANADMVADQESYYGDTGYDNGEPSVDEEAEDASWIEEAKWWKLSADIVLEAGEIDLNLTRDIYTEDMTLICEQTLVFEQALQLDSPFGGEERWFSVVLLEGNSDDCPYTREETELQFGIGPLISDLAVATEMVEWENETDSESWAEIEPLGAYIFDADQETVVGYGLSYSLITETEQIGLRPIYSFAW